MAESTPGIRLFLSEGPPATIEEESQHSNMIAATLTELESAIWALIMSSGGGRSEARLWLHTTISSIPSIEPSQKLHIFTSLLNSRPTNPRLSAHLFLLMFRKRPELAGGVLAMKSHLLRSFFRADPNRVHHWFSTTRGGIELGKGAKALSHFAFVNRDMCWAELEWRGKHGQSPAMVATKPHYFLDLDMPPTVSNFLRHVPEFWSSSEFSDSLRDGDILSTDTVFFCDMLSSLLSEDSPHVWDAVTEFITDEPFSSICRHLLPALTEEDLQKFLRMTKGCLPVEQVGSKNEHRQSFWLETALWRCREVPKIEELLVVEAVVNEGRQLLRILKEEGGEEEEEVGRAAVDVWRGKMEEVRMGMEEWREGRGVGVVKWMGILAWSLHYMMREKVEMGVEWERIFLRNGIDFRRGEGYEAVGGDGKEEKRGRKKMKKEEGTGRWRLSIDGYSGEWETADLPEMLSKHCFCTWMKWVMAQK